MFGILIIKHKGYLPQTLEIPTSYFIEFAKYQLQDLSPLIAISKN